MTLRVAGFWVHLVAPAESQYLDETVCSLRFAARAQKVRGPPGGWVKETTDQVR